MVVDSLQYNTIENSALRNTEAILGMVHGNIVFQQVFCAIVKKHSTSYFNFLEFCKRILAKMTQKRYYQCARLGRAPIGQFLEQPLQMHGMASPSIVKIEHT